MSETSPAAYYLIRAEIDLGALRHNVALAKRLAGGTSIMAAVKANAYGHTTEIVVPELRRAGVEAFGVASAREGAELRAMGVTETILVFGELIPEHLQACVEHRLAVTVSSLDAVDSVVAAGKRLSVHVKVDTGMHRLGLQPDEVAEAMDRLRKASHVRIDGIWTHLATSDEEDLSFARTQISRFDEIRRSAGATDIGHHVANSGALVQLPVAVAGRSFVRPGGLIYGLASTDVVAASVQMRPVMRLVSRVVQIRRLDAGEPVSYGRTWHADADALVATVAVGYGDGFPRALSNRGQVVIGARRFPIAGRVCMDMLMVNLGPPDGPGASVQVGDEVILFGRDGPGTLEQAQAADLLSYELPTGIAERVERVAVDPISESASTQSITALSEEPR